ncbi:hypothetical protein [Streptacidiphilus rugosus]|uniref:hypothetical protein n=1 Tax=Streptacidiphilus rugosus TaxID=405783 RepID=UPI000567B736|nr:hypothetical protein [Streptacidiphilus rugosus]
MTTDAYWTDQAPPPPPWPPAPPVTGGRPPKRVNRTALAVLLSLLMLAGLAVGLVLFLGASASAVGGCGGG